MADQIQYSTSSLLGAAVVLVTLIGGMYVMSQLDDYRIGIAESNLRDLEKYVAGLEDRERKTATTCRCT